MRAVVRTAAQWKTFYAHERARLGEMGLAQRLDRAPDVDLPPGGALVFPHTMLSVTGDLTAAVARAVVRSGADEVLALGVLHGGREKDADAVRRARAGDRAALAALRGVHEAGEAICDEEFSLDGFEAMLALAAAREGRKPPRVHARYPFLVGDDPASLPGLDEAAKLAARMPVVATTDPIHHGAGYGTPPEARRFERDEATHTWARGCIEGRPARRARRVPPRRLRRGARRRRPHLGRRAAAALHHPPRRRAHAVRTAERGADAGLTRMSRPSPTRCSGGTGAPYSSSSPRRRRGSMFAARPSSRCTRPTRSTCPLAGKRS
jgi:hypothetical protein